MLKQFILPGLGKSSSYNSNKNVLDHNNPTKPSVCSKSCDRAAHLNLFDSWPLEPKVKAVVAEAADLWMIAIVAHADDWNLAQLYQLYQFLHTESHCIASH